MYLVSCSPSQYGQIPKNPAEFYQLNSASRGIWSTVVLCTYVEKFTLFNGLDANRLNKKCMFYVKRFCYLFWKFQQFCFQQFAEAKYNINIMFKQSFQHDVLSNLLKVPVTKVQTKFFEHPCHVIHVLYFLKVEKSKSCLRKIQLRVQLFLTNQSSSEEFCTYVSKCPKMVKPVFYFFEVIFGFLISQGI